MPGPDSEKRHFSSLSFASNLVKYCSTCDPSISPEEFLGPSGPEVGNGVENEFQKVKIGVENE